MKKPRKPKTAKQAKPIIIDHTPSKRGKSPVQVASSAVSAAFKNAMLGHSHVAERHPALVSPKPSKPYAQERLDMVQAEINHAMAQDPPNWVYIDMLEKERKHWDGRVKLREAVCYLFGVPPWMLGDVD